MTRKRIRVLCAIDSLTGGGAERILTRLANRFSRDVFSVQLAMTLGPTILQEVASHVPVVDLFRDALSYADLSPPEGSLVERVMAAAAVALSGPSYWRDDTYPAVLKEIRILRFAIRLLAKHVRAWSPDCILSFLPNTNLITLIARHSYGLRTPIVCSDRNVLSRELETLPLRPLRGRLIRAFYGQADRHVTMTDAAADDLQRNFGIPRDRMLTIFNGVDPEELQARAREGLPRPWNHVLGDETPTLIQVGRLTKQKGNDLLLEALATIRKRPWRLIMLGDGDRRELLVGRASQLGLTERIHFLAWDPNPYRWIARSDLLVLSSRWEGFPNVLLEAMALEVAAIATDCPTGPAEILDRGRFGRLVEPNNVAALAKAIEGLLHDEAERKKLAALGAQRAREFSSVAMVRKFEDLILETTGMRGAPHH